jgi:hypothetical protein
MKRLANRRKNGKRIDEIAGELGKGKKPCHSRADRALPCHYRAGSTVQVPCNSVTDLYHYFKRYVLSK